MRRLLPLAGATLLIAAAGGASGQQAGVGSIITRAMFESMLSHRGDQGCQGAFYTYDAFIKAAGDFPRFGTTGNDETRRRELAAFFGQTSHETTGSTHYSQASHNLHSSDHLISSVFICKLNGLLHTKGGWATAPDGPFAWGYCRVNEITPSDPPYYGRGPIQLTQYVHKKKPHTNSSKLLQHISSHAMKSITTNLQIINGSPIIHLI